MKTVKGILLLVFVFAICVPCFGSDIAIKRKKNKNLYTEKLVKITDANGGIQFEVVFSAN
ncbi:MAG: hypothetical protein LBC47_00245 [Tannerella sp.]|jgi:hypothetical protein|nr:hypothetical protein [Tannerella sp.]